MKIQSIVWDRVEVICPEDSIHNDTYQEATVSLMISDLLIQEQGGMRSGLYIKAELLDMKPNFMHFKAYWWESSFVSPSELTMLPVDIKIILTTG